MKLYRRLICCLTLAALLICSIIQGAVPVNAMASVSEAEDVPASGVYETEISLLNINTDTASMGDAAIEKTAQLLVSDDGTMSLKISLNSMQYLGMDGYLLKFSRMYDIVMSKYHYPETYTSVPAEVLEYYENVYDIFNDANSEYYDPNTEGEFYPKTISIPISMNETDFFVEVYVPVMESIGTGQGTKQARLSVDWDNLKRVSGISEDTSGSGGSQSENSGNNDSYNKNGSENTGGNDDPADETGSDNSDSTNSLSEITLDSANLSDGIYAVTGSMMKPDQSSASMADSAINHTIKLTVSKGTYYLTVTFHGLSIGTKQGYLSQLKYYTSGYTVNEYGSPGGALAAVSIDSYQTDSDGARVEDAYGTDYPAQVTFPLISEAKSDGIVPLQVFVPVMESISSGTGTQSVYLILDWSTLREAQSDDSSFTDDSGYTAAGENSGTSSGSTGSVSGGSSITGSSGITGSSSSGGTSPASGTTGSTGTSSSVGTSTSGTLTGSNTSSGATTASSSSKKDSGITAITAGAASGTSVLNSVGTLNGEEPSAIQSLSDAAEIRTAQETTGGYAASAVNTEDEIGEPPLRKYVLPGSIIIAAAIAAAIAYACVMSSKKRRKTVKA